MSALDHIREDPESGQPVGSQERAVEQLTVALLADGNILLEGARLCRDAPIK